MGDHFIRHIALLGFEKRFVPSQHYVYMFLVKWHDLSEKVVYRRFTEIYEFHGSSQALALSLTVPGLMKTLADRKEGG